MPVRSKKTDEENENHPFLKFQAEQHSLAIQAIGRLESRVDDKFDKIDEKIESKLDKIIECMSESKLILQKISSTEEKIEVGDKNLHHRLDEHNVLFKEIFARQNGEGCPVAKNIMARSEERLETFKEKEKKLLEEIVDLKERLKLIEEKPTKALGMFAKGLLTAAGTLFAGWLFTKGIK